MTTDKDRRISEKFTITVPPPEANYVREKVKAGGKKTNISQVFTHCVRIAKKVEDATRAKGK